MEHYYGLFQDQVECTDYNNMTLNQRINDRFNQSWHFLLIKAEHEDLEYKDVKAFDKATLSTLKQKLMAKFGECCGI